MRVEVTTVVSPQRVVGKNGRRLSEQQAYIKFPKEKYPRMIKIPLWDDEPTISEGVYEMALDECMEVGNFDSLQFRFNVSALTLIPKTKPAAKSEE